MVSEFFFFFTQFNIFFFIFERKDQIKKKTKLVETKIMEIFQYKKNNDEY